MIKEISLRDIPGYYKFGKVQQEVNTFYQSGWPAAEVDTDGYTSTASCFSAFKKATQNLHLDSVSVISRKGRIFLIRSDDDYEV